MEELNDKSAPCIIFYSHGYKSKTCFVRRTLYGLPSRGVDKVSRFVLEVQYLSDIAMVLYSSPKVKMTFCV